MTAASDRHLHQVTEAVSYLGNQLALTPEILVSLGTGLTELPAAFQKMQAIPYAEIPYFPTPTVDTHPGTLILGTLAGHPVAVLQGRLHYYEGYSTREVCLPVRCLSLLGCRRFIAGNAAGGLKPGFGIGDFMIITDHLNLIPDNPLRGPNNEEWGVRFPEMSQAYSLKLAEIAAQCAGELAIRCHRGVYGAISGPSLETPAETRMLRMCGVDAVGMSTVPEVLVARHAGLEVLAISIIANVNDPANFQPILLAEVVKQIKKSEQQFLKLLDAVIRNI